MLRLRSVLGAVLAVCTLGGCTAPPETGAAEEPARLRVEVLDVLPHDPTAFTQGFELAGGTLYEGTGRFGRSAVTAGPPGGPPHTRVELPERLFGEGITIVGDRLWQLTWKAGIAIERDRQSLTEIRRVHYEGQGWGLCYQRGKDRLVMSDGSARLTFRDPQTFEVLGSTVVGSPAGHVTRLNELECVGNRVYANIWQTHRIARIDPGTGRVTAFVDASGLLTGTQAQQAGVLNGIAAIAGTDTFLLTGKLWPKTFRVRFVPARR